MSDQPKTGRGAPDAADNEKKTPPDSRPAQPTKAREIGGRKGPDPTRYGDWEKNGRCVDF